ncbi:hypothetical protein NDU88_001871 [Pleurodeles waltl]|uniref:Uncharacterized protein n=1 Tax=Pleurodeles waltl TaxID=8319 RepID=A0AAV7P760_PLEWA|nr:hypothetical protein NDU88_001871 [Pleurodeles waltl]
MTTHIQRWYATTPRLSVQPEAHSTESGMAEEDHNTGVTVGTSITSNQSKGTGLAAADHSGLGYAADHNLQTDMASRNHSNGTGMIAKSSVIAREHNTGADNTAEDHNIGANNTAEDHNTGAKLELATQQKITTLELTTQQKITTLEQHWSGQHSRRSQHWS